MKKRLAKMVAMATAMVLVIGSNSLAAMAAEETQLQKVVTKWDTTKASTWEWSDVTDETTVEKTEVDEANDISSADISILAKVIEHGDIVYKVDISWGAMKFEFNNQAGKWNTTTHTYDPDPNTRISKEWTVDGYINGQNNLITVVNHSNWAVDTQYSYDHQLVNQASMVNSDPSATNAVRGHFFLSNDAAKKAATVLENSADVENALDADDKVTLGHQDADNDNMYGGGEESVYPHTEEVYFTFNGTPDPDTMSDEIKADFVKVGVITVTIAPYKITEEEG